MTVMVCKPKRKAVARWWILVVFRSFFKYKLAAELSTQLLSSWDGRLRPGPVHRSRARDVTSIWCAQLLRPATGGQPRIQWWNVSAAALQVHTQCRFAAPAAETLVAYTWFALRIGKAAFPTAFLLGNSRDCIVCPAGRLVCPAGR